MKLSFRKGFEFSRNILPILFFLGQGGSLEKIVTHNDAFEIVILVKISQKSYGKNYIYIFSPQLTKLGGVAGS